MALPTPTPPRTPLPEPQHRGRRAMGKGEKGCARSRLSRWAFASGFGEDKLGTLSHEWRSWCMSRGFPRPKHAFTRSSIGYPKSKRQYPELASFYKGSAVKILLFFTAEQAQLP
jgi:hypothetical protein